MVRWKSYLKQETLNVLQGATFEMTLTYIHFWEFSSKVEIR